jgi:hypothetical protein
VSKKAAKRAAKAAAPSPADLADVTPEAAPAEQPVDRHAASGSGYQPSAQQTSGSAADAGADVQPPTGSGADNSWQLCALTKVCEAHLAHGAVYGIMHAVDSLHLWLLNRWCFVSCCMHACAAGQDE